MPFFSKVSGSPLLALDIRPEHIRAVLFQSGGDDLFRLTLPLDGQDVPEAEDDPQARPFTAAHWQGLLAAAGQPEAAVILAASGWDAAPAREAFFRRLFAASDGKGVEIALLAAGDAPPELLRLSRIQRISQFPASESFCASILGVLADGAVRARSFREGIALAFLGRGRAQAALVFQDRLLAVAERECSGPLAAADFLEQLESFRLGWLPGETMRDLGGFSIVLPDLPPEAEGFRPLFLTGPEAALLAGQGIPASCEDSVCLGLLHGFSMKAQG